MDCSYLPWDPSPCHITGQLGVCLQRSAISVSNATTGGLDGREKNFFMYDNKESSEKKNKKKAER